MRPSICSQLLTLALLVAPGFAQKLDHYGDALPSGAIARLGTKRLQTKGGFGWTPDGKSLATLRGGTVYFWDLADGHCRETLLVPVNPDPFATYGTKFVVSKDGQKLICGDSTGGLATWDLATSQTVSQAGDKNRHEENIAVALHPSGKQFVTLRRNGELQIRDFATCRETRTIKFKDVHWREGTPAAFSPDGKVLALGYTRNSSIYLVDIDKEAEPQVVKKAHSHDTYHLDFLADGRLFSVGTRRGPAATADDPQPQNQLLIWDLSQQPPASREFPLGTELPAGCSAGFSADGRALVTVHNDRVVTWDVATEKITRTIEGPRFRNAMHAIVAIDPTGKHVAVDDRENYVRIWEVATGKAVLSTERHHQSGVFAVAWSPDGSRIATGGFEGEVRVWDAVSGEPLVKFRGPDWGVFSVRYTPDATQLIVCGDQPGPFRPKLGSQVSGPVRVHDAESGKRLQELTVPDRPRLLTPSPDGSRIALATQNVDGELPHPATIRLLDLRAARELGKIELGEQEAKELCWSEGGRSLFVVIGTKVVQIDAQTLKSSAEAVLPHVYEDPRTKLLVGGTIHHAAFLRHGTGIVTTSWSKEIYGWRLPGGEKEWTLKTESQHFRGLALSPDQRLLAAVCTADDQSFRLRLFDLPARRLITSFDLGRTESADRAVFSPDGNRILVGFYDGTALIYDVSELR